MFGVPMNVDTGSNESHHKLTKVVAKLTQKDPTTFEEQTSHRLDDIHVLNLAMQEFQGQPLWDYEVGYRKNTSSLTEEGTNNSNVTGGMKYMVYSDN